MKKLTCLAMILLSANLLSAQEPEDAKKALISSHIDYAKSDMDRKCTKIKKKIKRLEEAYYSNDISEERRSEIMSS